MLVIAHRGASAYELENTLAAFRAARDLGADAIELDVHATADGVIVVHHDESIDSCHIPTSSSDAVLNQQLVDGQHPPALSHVLDEVGADLVVYVEIKTLASAHDAEFVDTLDSGPRPTNYHVHSFDHRVVRRLLLRNGDLVGGVLSKSYLVDSVGQLQSSGATELWQTADLIDKPLVDKVHQVDGKVIAWVVDDPKRIRQFRDMGVDGVCTNKPDIARSALS